MTALDRQPQDYNFLSPLNFKCYFKRAPATVYNLTKINLPGISLPSVLYDTPFVDIPEVGDHATFNPLTFSFKVSEDLQNYFELHAWIRAYGGADQFEDYKAIESHPNYTGLGVKSDFILFILDSAKNAIFEITYHDCVPIELSDIIFDTSLDDIGYLTASAEFRYINYDYTRVI